MARHKDMNWCLPDGTKNPDGGSTHQWESIRTALLMDIRDELKAINRVLNCSNFLTLPKVLADIKRNTTKPKRKKAAA